MKRLLVALLLLASSSFAAEPGIYNPNVYDGETFVRDITWRDENGDPVDLTGYTARLQIRHTPVGSNTAVLTLIQGSGLTLGGVNGTIQWTMTAAQTARIPCPGQLPYDLRLTSPAGVVTYLLQGNVACCGTWTQ